MSGRWISLVMALALSACGDAAEGDPLTCPALPPGATDAHPRAAQYQDVLDAAAHAALPGAIMLVRDSDGLWIGATGLANIGTGTPMQPCHRFPVASNTKTVTAAAVLALAEEGQLSIDDPMRDHLGKKTGDTFDHGGGVTIRQLLNHSSGIFNYTHSLGWLLDQLNDPDVSWTARECLAFAEGQDPYFGPGEGYEYSNTNYTLLGEIIENASSVSTEQYFKERIFAPLGMNGTTFARDDFGEGYVRGYYDIYGNGAIVDVTETIFRDCMTEDGGMISTAYDLSLFLDGLVRTDQVLNEESLERMMDAEQVVDDKNRYGLGLQRTETPHGIAWGHSGSKFGYLSDMLYFPEHDLTFVFLSNASGAPSWPYQDRLDEALAEVIRASSPTE